MTTQTAQSTILTLVFTDLVDSTALKAEKGDRVAGDLIARHRASVQKLADQHHGRIIDWAGDGCFLTFNSSSAATFFALNLQEWHFSNPEIPKLRTGIHIGEVTESEKVDGGGTTYDVEGLSVDLSSRIQTLAMPNQVLMSEALFNMVRSRVRAEEFGVPVSWRAHGPYALKGIDEPMGICEIGIEGLSPLLPPESSEKAHRVVSPADEETLGWRPAIGLEVPMRERWFLKEKLGEGGYGEVWLAEHEKSKAMRVYKFCFDPENVRSLKREMVLFRLLKETLGHRKDIAEMIDWQFATAPFFLESEYSEGGNLVEWIESKGDLKQIPIETRLELVAQMAVATGAAHSVGVLHKDIKPANILISEHLNKGMPQAVLTDFGIGLIMNKDALAEQGITMAGFTQTFEADETMSTGAGTRLYMAPEVVEGKPSTTLSDIYSLGVILYQMASGDLTHTIAPGWERDIDDEFLRQDIAACVDGQPERRISSADALAERLRTLQQRREEHDENVRVHREALRATEIASRARLRRRQFSLFTAIGIFVTLVVGVIALREFQRAETQSALRSEAEEQGARAEANRVLAENQRAMTLSALNRSEQRLYYETISTASQRHAEDRIQSMRLKLQEAPAEHRNWEWGYLLRSAYSDLFSQPEQVIRMTSQPGETASVWKKSRGNLIATLEGHQSEINDIDAIGNRIVTASDDGTVRLWRLGEESSIRTFGEGQDPLFCVAMNADFDLVAAGGFGGGLYVWSMSSGETLFSVQREDSGLIDSSGSIGDIQISQDGTSIYITRRNSISVFDVSSGEFRKRMAKSGNVVSEVAVLDGENGFMTVNLAGVVEKWDEKRDTPISTTSYPSESTAVSARLHVASHRAVTAYASGEIVSWDAFTGKGAVALDGATPETTHVSGFSEDGTAIVMPDRDKGAVLYDAETGARLTNLRAEDQILRAAVFHPDGRRIVAGTVNGTLLVWEPIADSEEPDSERLRGHNDTVYNAHFSPDSRLLATASFDKTVRIWDVVSGREVAVLSGHDTEVLYVQFSPDGKRLRSYSADHVTILWDMANFEAIRTFEGDPSGRRLVTPERVRAADVMGGGALMNSAFDPGQAFYIVNAIDSIEFLDVKTGEPLKRYQNPELDAGFQAISSDGSVVVTTHDDKDLWVIDSQSLERTHRLQGHKSPITMPNISPDGKTLVSSSFDKTIRLWDVVDGKHLRTLEGHNAFVVTARFDKTGKRILSSSGDGTARLWDVESGEELARFNGHTNMVINASFNPDQSRVLTYSHDSTAKIWDLEGRELFTIDMKMKGEEKDGAITNDKGGTVYGEWSPDGRTIVIVGLNGAVHLLRAVLWDDLATNENEDTDLDFQKGIEQWIEKSKDIEF
jgi:WD40 repeat protein/class 3 adenylate cyclase